MISHMGKKEKYEQAIVAQDCYSGTITDFYSCTVTGTNQIILFLQSFLGLLKKVGKVTIGALKNLGRFVSSNTHPWMPMTSSLKNDTTLPPGPVPRFFHSESMAVRPPMWRGRFDLLIKDRRHHSRMVPSGKSIFQPSLGLGTLIRVGGGKLPHQMDVAEQRTLALALGTNNVTFLIGHPHLRWLFPIFGFPGWWCFRGLEIAFQTIRLHSRKPFI